MKHLLRKPNTLLGLAAALLLLSWQSRAQSSYNRYEATPASAPKSASTKAQADASRKVAFWNNEPPLKRGIGQRIRDKQLVPADESYFKLIGSTVKYPREALRTQTSGTIKILVSVNPAGEVTNTQLLESTTPAGEGGREALIQETHRVFRQLRFEPAAQATEEELSLPFVAL